MSDDTTGGRTGLHRRPNVLIITVDEMQYPRFSYGPDAGMPHGIKEVLGFEGNPAENEYARYFPGFLKLRRNAVVLRNHTIAASACTPSRSCIYTGQYGTRTGVTQTDGVFKSGSDPAFPWLDPNGIPTLGDWFRAAGYTTHYFGKWHISHPDDGSLEPWGFSDYEVSFPEPHGSNPKNLGVYRDIGFTDNVVTFLDRKGLAVQGAAEQDEKVPPPWLAVASLVNPHDIAGFPLPWFAGVENFDPPYPAPQPIPAHGQTSNPPPGGTYRVQLNPEGFPAGSWAPTPTQDEDLSTKPDCQQDMAYKVGLALAARWPNDLRPDAPLPYQLSQDPPGWFDSNGQWYAYFHYLVDLQIRRIMDAVERGGHAEDTIIVFFSDHGDYAGAHGGALQKWHSAYAEAVHVPFVVSSPRVNPEDQIRYVDALTSHIDVVPTVLGLAGLSADELAGKIEGQDTSWALPGADLSPVIRGESHKVVEGDGQERRAVLFITDDTITQPIPNEVGNHAYQYFLAHVAELVDTGAAPIRRGCVVEPCHVQSVKNHEWKLARYWDPHGNAADQWELYSQAHDPNEEINLVGWTAEGRPEVRADAIPDTWGISAEQVERALERMIHLLDDYSRRMLSVDDGSDKPQRPRADDRRLRVGPNFTVTGRLEEGAIAP